MLSTPQRCETVSKPAAIESASAMSTADTNGIRRTGRLAGSQRRRRARPWPLAITATRAPSAARVWAMASPMPLLPPVTTAVAPANPRSIALPFVSRRDADSAQAEADDLVADGASIAISGRPLPFDTRPYHAVNRQRIGGRVDVGKHAECAFRARVVRQAVSGSRRRRRSPASGDANICDCASSDIWRRSDLI